jgi:hypothetical protein
MYYYDTFSEAIAGLRKRGFDIDFNLKENCLVCNNGKFTIEGFEVAEVYRFDGNTDPSDEAIVFGIESKTGLKGIFVSG